MLIQTFWQVLLKRRGEDVADAWTLGVPDASTLNMKRFQYILHGQMARINIAIAKSQTDLGKVLR